MVEISYDYEVPPRSGHSTRYPFRLMEVGASFALAEVGANVSTVRAAAIRYGRQHDVRFSIRRDSTGAYRCWRVE